MDARSIETRVEVLPEQAIEIGATVLRFEPASAAWPIGPASSIAPSDAPWRFPIGWHRSGEPAIVDLSRQHLVVIGPYGSGRSSALGVLAGNAGRAEIPPDLRLLAPRRSPLTEWTGWSSIAAGKDAVDRELNGLDDLLLAGHPALVCIDDAQELLDRDRDDLESVLRRARDTTVRFAIAVEGRAAHRTFGGWLLEALSSRNALLLQPDPDVDGELVGATLDRVAGLDEPGVAYLVRDGSASLIKLAPDVE